MYRDNPNDCDVDGFDFLEWQRGYGTIYDATHLAAWESNYGAPLAATSATTIPEPSTLLLGAIASVGLMLRRRCLAR